MKQTTNKSKIITLGIDGNEANVEKRVGVNTYAFELLKNLALLQEEWKNDFRLIVYLKSKPLADMPKEIQNFKYKVLGGKGNWIFTKLTPHLLFKRGNLDVFFSPSHYVPPIATMPRVCSIMDLGYLEFTGQFKKFDFWQLKVWSAISIYISKAIISISDTTKDDIVRHYPFAKNKIHTTKLGYDSKKFNLNISENDVRRVKNKYSIVSDYVLYLGTLKPSKNIESLVEAFYLFKNKIKLSQSGVPKVKNLKLLIAGKKGWLYESIFQKVKDYDMVDDVVFTDYLPEKDKPALIKGAKVFVIPSYWEGFGIDAISAMACGVPVISSDKGSLPEVVGDAGILIDPYKPLTIANAMKEVILGGEKKYNRLRALGLMHAAGFSWRKTALKTLEVIKKVV